jgi:hypothetical protein
MRPIRCTTPYPRQTKELHHQNAEGLPCDRICIGTIANPRSRYTAVIRQSVTLSKGSGRRRPAPDNAYKDQIERTTAIHAVMNGGYQSPAAANSAIRRPAPKNRYHAGPPTMIKTCSAAAVALSADAINNNLLIDRLSFWDDLKSEALAYIKAHQQYSGLVSASAVSKPRPFIRNSSISDFVHSRVRTPSSNRPAWSA